MKILNMTDLHLGHPHTKTEENIASLMYFMEYNHKKIKVVDMIVFSGDVYDGLVSQGSKDNVMIMGFLLTSFCICRRPSLKPKTHG